MLKLLEDFKAFVLRGNVIDLAIAVIIGVAFGNVIHALVRDLITPLIAAIGAQPDFGSLAFTMNRARFRYGDVIDATLEFLIIAAVVYFLVVAPMNRLLALRRGPERPTTRQCSECLSEIPREARRCSYCTSPQVPEPV
jgi:large conductance mechanosensitive channel